MDNTLVLVNFTSNSNRSVEQAIELSKLTNSSLTLCHIAKSESDLNSSDSQGKIENNKSMFESAGVDYNVYLDCGDYKKKVSQYVTEHRPNLVVVATHGKKGLRQSLLGLIFMI